MRISIIVPVLNEQDGINRVIEEVLNLERGDMLSEVVAVDGDMRGSTVNLILLNDEKLKTVISKKGRACQMNSGVDLTSGDVLLFLHADTRLPKNSLIEISETLENGYAGGAFSLKIDSDYLFLKFVSCLTNLRSRITKIPYGDQAIFIRKSVFQDLGGYTEMPILEDVDLMKKLKKGGYRINIVHDQVLTSARRWKKNGILKTTIKNRIIILLYLLGVRLEKLKKIYRGENMSEDCLIIFVRNPELGKVKTRLAKDFGEEATLELYKNFIMDILNRVESSEYSIRIFAWPPGSDAHLKKIFGTTYQYRHQKGGDLGKRMEHAFMETFSEGFQRAILIGSDVPQIDKKLIEKGFSELEKHNAVIGPAKDGGYYLIGFNKDIVLEELFKEIEWGIETVYRDTIEKFGGMSYSELETLMDIDYFEDLVKLYKENCSAELKGSYTCKYLKKVLK